MECGSVALAEEHVGSLAKRVVRRDKSDVPVVQPDDGACVYPPAGAE